ncbi:hypothetical protein F5Y05DRAFT_387642 [Hypoxylon sp. FL0543]|nr:hypothetical protein F5Y05DRAFT_387642 [Hypoxylon sp. FL0543]
MTTPTTSDTVFQEGHPIRAELVQFYARVGFQCHADPRWELGPYIDREAPGFAAEVLRNLFSAGEKLKLLGLPKICFACQSVLDMGPSTRQYKALLCPTYDSYGQDAVDGPVEFQLTNGWVAGSEVKCAKCTRKASGYLPY